MNDPLRVGLIGAGGIGAAHLQALEQLESEGGARLVGIADPFPERLEETKTRMESRGIRWHLDFQELIEQESDLDAVVIATPISLHARMTAAALARGLFVYLEKPPVAVIQQLNDLISLDHRRKVAVGFQYIASHPVLQIKQWKMEGRLGELQSVRVYGGSPRRSEYYHRAPWAGKMMLHDEPVFDGPATNALSHFLHNIMFLTGRTMDGFDVPDEVQGEFYRARPLESYDTVSLRGRMESGPTFSFAASHAVEENIPVHLEAVGSRGRAWISNNGQTFGCDCGGEATLEPVADSFLQSYRAFVEFAKGARPRAATRLEDARGYVLTTNGALMSSGGIHPIDPQHFRIYGDGERQGYDISGLGDLLKQSAVECKLFSELEAPWARKGHAVLVRSLRSLKLKDYMSH